MVQCKRWLDLSQEVGADLLVVACGTGRAIRDRRSGVSRSLELSQQAKIDVTDRFAPLLTRPLPVAVRLIVV